MIQAVLFDLYETLITEWEDNQKKATYSIAPLGINEKEYKVEWAKRVEKRMDGTYPDHQTVLREIVTSLGKSVDEQVIEEVHQQRVSTKLKPFQEIDSKIINMLQALRKRNVKIGLISNCTPEEVIGFKDSRLAKLFDDVIFSYKVKQAKPNAEIYLTACQNLKVSPESCLFIGDGGSNELRGASMVGMQSFQAVWFLPAYISERITEFPKLENPMQVLDLIAKGSTTNEEID
ncbi:HAD family hydrolase [Paucisalibacillus globulus]|uniref:HAD family hydrolase n=1 Tax=Paucisalibacillus globulus TaxID=351095 RepID=UPI0003F8AD50|nr:HAD family hydrolase [Paucisalibacillus globulus]